MANGPIPVKTLNPGDIFQFYPLSGGVRFICVYNAEKGGVDELRVLSYYEQGNGYSHDLTYLEVDVDGWTVEKFGVAW